MKKVGTAVYVHKTALNQLQEKISKEEFERIKTYCEILDSENFSYQIIKYNKGKISFIESLDWNTSNEPMVGNAWCYNEFGERRFIKSSGKIYHCKHLFVNDDYIGFDIEKAKEREKEWNSIPNIKKHKSRIGNKKYWEELLKKYNIEI